jgi:hypothetical protein
VGAQILPMALAGGMDLGDPVKLTCVSLLQR